MTEQETRFEEAQLLPKLDRIEHLLGGLTEEQVEGLEGQWPNQIPRLPAVINVLRPRIEAADPLVLTANVLDQTTGFLDAVINGFQLYSESGGIEHLNGLPEWTEGLIGLVAQWPSGPDLPSTDVREMAKKFRQSAGQQLRRLKGDFDKVKSEIAAVQEDLAARSGEWGEQKTNLESQLSDLSGTIDQQRGRLDQAIESYQGQFSEAQERRNEEHRQQLTELQTQIASLENDLQEGIDKALSEAQQKTTATVEDLQRELLKAQEITSFVGGTSTAAGYGKEAEAQKTIADRLRFLAIAFGLAAAGLAVWAVVHAQDDDDPSLTVVLAKTIVSLVFAGLAGYVATQSGHHRAREENARRRELDLLALPAFIATLPDDEKEEITGQVASRLFLTPAVSENQSEAALTKESISLIGLLLDAVRRGSP